MAPSTIWLCRHGERLDNVDPTWNRNFPHLTIDNSPMNLRGHTQAQEVANYLGQCESFDYIFTSPFRRCVQTAHKIAEHLNKKIYIEPGICENLLIFPPGFESVETLKHEFYTIDESYISSGVKLRKEHLNRDAIMERIHATVEIVFPKYNGNVLLVGHGASIGGLIEELNGKWENVGQCTLSKFHRNTSGKYVTEMIGSDDHLSDKTNLRA